MGFYAESLPFHLYGIFGPGAPHVFDFSRRCDLGWVTCSRQIPLFFPETIDFSTDFALLQVLLKIRLPTHSGRMLRHTLMMLSSGHYNHWQTCAFQGLRS